MAAGGPQGVPCSVAAFAAVSLLLPWQEALTTGEPALGSSARAGQAQPTLWCEPQLITTCLSPHGRSCIVLVHWRDESNNLLRKGGYIFCNSSGQDIVMWTSRGQFTLLLEIAKLEQRCQTPKVYLPWQAELVLHLTIF